MTNDFDELRAQLRQFALERDWAQFHSPKNLVMALAVEASELMEPFQWLTEQQSRHLDAETRAQVEQELADVLLYLIQLADQLDVSLTQAAKHKLEQNALKYPVDKSYGTARKMDER